MARPNFRGPTIDKEILCGCGNKAKLGSRRNYPFGRKSKAVTTKFYRCKSCGQVKILGKPAAGFGGRR